MSDTINRDEAIKAINIWVRTPHDIVSAYYADLAEKAVLSVPSEDRPTWIPCSEREPNEFEDVLVCLTDGTMDVVQLTDYISIDGEPKWCHSTNYTLGGAILNKDVIAWMPLPEPYKESEKDGRKNL